MRSAIEISARNVRSSFDSPSRMHDVKKMCGDRRDDRRRVDELAAVFGIPVGGDRELHRAREPPVHSDSMSTSGSGHRDTPSPSNSCRTSSDVNARSAARNSSMRVAPRNRTGSSTSCAATSTSGTRGRRAPDEPAQGRVHRSRIERFAVVEHEHQRIAERGEPECLVERIRTRSDRARAETDVAGRPDSQHRLEDGDPELVRVAVGRVEHAPARAAGERTGDLGHARWSCPRRPGRSGPSPARALHPEPRTPLRPADHARRLGRARPLQLTNRVDDAVRLRRTGGKYPSATRLSNA